MKSLRELMNLEGRVALVTGGAGAIGSAICETFAELGAQIVVLDLDEGICQIAAKKLNELHNVDVLPIAQDLTDEIAMRSVPGQILQHFGRLDILVHCAAFIGESNLKGWVTPFEEQSLDTWRQAIEVNLNAPFVLTQACTPALSNSGHGTVINIGSIYGMVGPDLHLYEDTALGNPAAYAASKGGLLQFTRWLATVLAPQVRVNSISLGGIQRRQPEVFQKRYVSKTPLNRMATEEDVKGAVGYLASDLSAYVTGHNLVVDGGWTAW